MINSKGQIGIILIGILALILLFLGVMMSIGVGALDIALDNALPELQTIGTVGSAGNISEYTDYAITPINTAFQSFTYMTGILYVFGLLAIIGLAFAFKMNNQTWLIPLFIIVAILVVIVSIFMSNIYQDFHDGNDDLANRMQQQVLLSWLIIYSPMVFSIIIFLAGIIMFTGGQDEFV